MTQHSCEHVNMKGVRFGATGDGMSMHAGNSYIHVTLTLTADQLQLAERVAGCVEESLAIGMLDARTRVENALDRLREGEQTEEAAALELGLGQYMQSRVEIEEGLDAATLLRSLVRHALKGEAEKRISASLAPHAATTEEDRRHLCTYEQALAATPDLPQCPTVNGRVVRGRYRATNETTGHGVLCSDLFIAHGYVAASRVIFPDWVFSLRVGDVRINEIEQHPDTLSRLADPNWREKELEAALKSMCAGVSVEELFP